LNKERGESSEFSRKATALRLWTVAVVAYAVATLMWLDRKAVTDAALQSMPGSHAADADAAPSALNTFRTLSARAGTHSAEEAVFDIPFRIGTLEQTRQYRFALLPAPGASACSVQVIAESDNRFSFSHVFANVALDRDVFTFHAPLTGLLAAGRPHWPVVRLGAQRPATASGQGFCQVAPRTRLEIVLPLRCGDANGGRAPGVVAGARRPRAAGRAL
jgi:hypothetical protein